MGNRVDISTCDLSPGHWKHQGSKAVGGQIAVGSCVVRGSEHNLVEWTVAPGTSRRTVGKSIRGRGQRKGSTTKRDRDGDDDDSPLQA
jgi:hypothetical protein